MDGGREVNPDNSYVLPGLPEPEHEQSAFLDNSVISGWRVPVTGRPVVVA